MPIFTYKAKKVSGEEVTGTREAATKQELARTFRREGFTLITATAEKKSTVLRSSASFMRIFGRVPLSEKMMFARNLSVMIQAGLALTKALDILEKQTENTAFKKIIAGVAESVRRGDSFSDSLRPYPKAFSSLFIAMVSAGETSGKLDGALDVLAIQMKNDYELRRRVRGALMYPAVIVVAMIIIGILMLIYVVPTLVATFEDLEIELPASTRFIIATSELLSGAGATLLLILPVILFLIHRVSRLPRVKRIIDTLIVHTPVIGELDKKMNSARTARTMGSLIRAGVPILRALEITKDVLQNHLFKDVLADATESVQRGNVIAQSFIEHENLYPVLVGEMLSVGEETGKTAEMLDRLADFYENEVAAATKDLSSIIEPVLMVIIGAVVGFFAVSMIQPLYSSISGGL